MILNYVDLGAIPEDSSAAVEWHNGAILTQTLSPANLTAGSTLLIPPGVFHVMGGIKSEGLTNVTIQIDGTLYFSDLVESWPRNEDGAVLECLHFKHVDKFRIVSSLGGGHHTRLGTLQGNGQKWWWWPLFGYLKHHEDRPRLLRIDRGTDILLKDILFLDSPYWTTKLTGVDGLEIAGCGISARRTRMDGHNLVDISAFNTDGFDISGHNVFVHDCNCWAQDDCFTVKDNYDGVSSNMLFENNNASGMAMVLGSIGGTHVKNITFRNFYVHHTFKGIYTKFRGGTGQMSDILFENIVMDGVEQYPIWIGPAQQADNPDPFYANPCSLCWPDKPDAVCFPIEESKMENITLRNVIINNPGMSLGVIMGSTVNPTKNLVFENVVVHRCGLKDKANIADSFPLLPMDIHDSYARDSFFILGGGLLLVCALLCCLPGWLCLKYRCCECWKNKRLVKTFLCFCLLLGALSPVFWWFSVTGSDKFDNSDFLECSSVEGAVAKGKTTPVPGCFEDLTTVNQDDFEALKFCDITKEWPWILFATGSLATFLWCWLKSKKDAADYGAELRDSQSLKLIEARGSSDEKL